MAQNTTQRKLTAILSADVKGYSKLMGDNDESTVHTITRYRKIITELIQNYQGRVVDTPGDNVLAEFGSALNAVCGAIKIQSALEIENGQLPANRRMDFRIGINLGDILHKDDCIYGDGVNVAARIESMADPGGICISRGVFDQVKNKVSQGFEYLGEQTVKNIAEPVRIYRVLLDAKDAGKILGEPRPKSIKVRSVYVIFVVTLLIAGPILYWIFVTKTTNIETATDANPVLPLPNRPSIAVLPLVNVSGDSDQDYFANAITRNITADLSHFSNLFVISSHSAFVYKGSGKSASQIGRELGVRYLLEGSLQRTQDRVRISVELIEAQTGKQLWAEKYEGDTKDLYATQDAITLAVVSSLGETIWRVRARDLSRKPIYNLTAFDYVLKGDELLDRLENPRENQQAREFYKKAIELDPALMRAHLGIGWTYFLDWLSGWTTEGDSVLAKAEYAASKAAALEENDAEIHRLLGRVAMAKGHHEEGTAHMERALELNPNNGDLIATYSMFLIYLGRHEEGLEWIKKAIRLNPHYPGWYASVHAGGYYMIRRYEEAIRVLQPQERHNFFDLRILAASYGQLGRHEAAQVQVQRILAINPQFSLKTLRPRLPYKHEEDIEHYLEGLRKAGLN